MIGKSRNGPRFLGACPRVALTRYLRKLVDGMRSAVLLPAINGVSYQYGRHLELQFMLIQVKVKSSDGNLL